MAKKKVSKSSIVVGWILKHPGDSYKELLAKGMDKIVTQQNYYDAKHKLKKEKRTKKVKKFLGKNANIIAKIEEQIQKDESTTLSKFIANTGTQCRPSLFQYHRKRILKEMGKNLSTGSVRENVLMQFLFEINTEGKTKEEEESVRTAMEKLASAKGTKIYIRELRNPEAIGVWSLKG